MDVTPIVDSDSDSSSLDMEAFLIKKRKLDSVLPVGFLDPLPPNESKKMKPTREKDAVVDGRCKQFWKAGDYKEDSVAGGYSGGSGGGGMDHLRVHPRFLHSNATSHKWALGALAELLDNSLDEVCNGASYVNVDVILNKKDSTNMLVVEDNGGGMSPDKLRQCMSLGYSIKSKLANTIGQYGNGFKTSTMRLGADVIVFSRCSYGNTITQSIGMLSYTFLTETHKEDIVVPMIDYAKNGPEWTKLVRSSSSDWTRNLETIRNWSPYTSEDDLLEQLNTLNDHGTRIVIYNLWEDDEGKLELDFDADPFDIQMRGVNRDEKKIEMAKTYPNSWHYLTYKHSLRSYASILYLRIPPGYRMILRGKDVEHHNLVNDMMLTKELTYKPVVDTISKNDPNMTATGTIGFVKDAKYHFDIQGFNVYHKNRLIKPFWRVWNAAGSDGRGVIGVLEANFVEPAHDKQGFERTTALARLEARLIQKQKDFWSTNCQEIGYAARRNKMDASPEPGNTVASAEERSSTKPTAEKNSSSNQNESPSRRKEKKSAWEDTSESRRHERIPPPLPTKACKNNAAAPTHTDPSKERSQNQSVNQGTEIPTPKVGVVINAVPLRSWKPNDHQPNPEVVEKTTVGDAESTEKKMNLLRRLEVEKEKRKELESKLEVAQRKIQEMEKEEETLIHILSEERTRRDAEEDRLRENLRVASNTIHELLNKLKFLQRNKPNK